MICTPGAVRITVAPLTALPASSRSTPPQTRTVSLADQRALDRNKNTKATTQRGADISSSAYTSDQRSDCPIYGSHFATRFTKTQVENQHYLAESFAPRRASFQSTSVRARCAVGRANSCLLVNSYVRSSASCRSFIPNLCMTVQVNRFLSPIGFGCFR